MVDHVPRERGASSIPCLDYDSSKDDFETWIEKFEYAVNVATNAPTPARRQQLYLQWLPLKLDNEARAILKQVPTGLNYEQTIARLKELLIDEVEIYKWKMLEKTIKWDGKESFQALATKVKNAVDRYEKELSPQGKIWAYFFRFRHALPATPYQDFIDTSLAKDDKTIENAKELALRVQMTQQSKEAKTDPKQVSFTGAAMSDDRIHALELDMAKMKVEREEEKRANSQNQNRDWYPRSPSRGRTEYPSSNNPSRPPSRDRFGNRYGPPQPSDGRSRRDQSFNRSSPRSGYSPQGYPRSSYSPQGYPRQGYSPSRYPPQDYRSQGYPPQGYPPQGYPQQGYPTQGYPPQTYPYQGQPPQGYPYQPFQPYQPQSYQPPAYQPQAYQPQSQQSQNSRPPSPRPANNQAQPSSGRDTRDNQNNTRPRSPSANRPNSNQNRGGARPRERFRALNAADEYSDFEDVDDEALNAYIESLVKVKNNRQTRRSREGHPEN